MKPPPMDLTECASKFRSGADNSDDAMRSFYLSETLQGVPVLVCWHALRSFSFLPPGTRRCPAAFVRSCCWSERQGDPPRVAHRTRIHGPGEAVIRAFSSRTLR